MTARLPPQAWMDWPATRRVIGALRAEGGAEAARFVGGCVRNAVIGQPVDDIDIATPLTPDRVTAAVQAAGLRAVPTGVEHGTVTVVADRRPFEVTTLRRDVETDGRRAVVAFTRNWAEDAARRDFRLNALYADPEGRLFDPTGGGLADAEAGRIVFVGDAETRIREDYLRILRFFRFTAWYGRGEPDAESLAACVRLRDGLERLSGERLGKETLKLLAAKDPTAAVRTMDRRGVTAAYLPQATNVERLSVIVPLTVDPMLRLSAWLSDDPAQVAAAAARLRLSNAQGDRLKAAVRETVKVEPGMPGAAVRAAVWRIGERAVGDRLLRSQAEGRGDAAEALAVIEAWAPPTFPLTGDDVRDAGVEAGPPVGAALRAAEEAWIASDFALDRAALLNGVRTGS